MKKRYIYLVLALAIGFSGSTGAAFLNGYFPCEIYGMCDSGVVAENERLMEEARQLREQIDQISQENLNIVEGLKENLESQKALNEALTTGISNIADISARGVSNEQKILEIGQTLRSIGLRLTAGTDQ